ncbi:MAG: NfeD family protein [Fibrobacterota bacterium]
MKRRYFDNMCRSTAVSAFFLFFLTALCLPLRGATHLVHLEGMVDHSMKNLVFRALDSTAGGDTLVFAVNSDGGRVDAALAISDSIFSSAVPNMVFVQNRALSAAALISVACDSVFMRHGATLGDCAPIVASSEGPNMLGEKVQSPLRAKFRAYADRAGYNELLSEAMVSQNITVWRWTDSAGTHHYLNGDEYSSLTKEEKNNTDLFLSDEELLTVTDEEALETGFSRGSFTNLSVFLDSAGMGISGQTFERSWSELFVSFIGSIAPLLMSLAMAALFVEFRSPGLGFPGAVGVILLVLVMGSQLFVGLADQTELLVLIIGFALLAAEIFIIPGFGVAGILGIACIALAGVLSLQGFVIPAGDKPWQVELFRSNISAMGYSFFGALVLIVLFFKYVFPRLNHVAPGVILDSVVADSSIDRDSQMDRTALVGAYGRVRSELHPTGRIEIDGTLYDGVSRGLFIDADTPVRVTGVSGQYLQVEEQE